MFNVKLSIHLIKHTYDMSLSLKSALVWPASNGNKAIARLGKGASPVGQACCDATVRDVPLRRAGTAWVTNKHKKAVLPQGNRAMPQVFFSVEVRQQHSLQV